MTHRGESVGDSMVRVQAATMKSAISVTDTTDLGAQTTDVVQSRSPDMYRRDQAAWGVPEGAANWLWVAPECGRALALVIGEISPVYRRGLATRFTRVEQIPVLSLHEITSSETEASRADAQLPYDDSSVDCVISTNLLNGWIESGPTSFRDPRFVAALSELRRVLRPNGVLFLGGRNARWYRVWLPLGAENGKPLRSAPHALGGARPFLPVGSARGALADAGFSEVRTYFVEPSIADPLTVVPANRRAVMALERGRWPRRSGILRSLSAAGGMYSFLYPDAFVLGIK